MLEKQSLLWRAEKQHAWKKMSFTLLKHLVQPDVAKFTTIWNALIIWKTSNNSLFRWGNYKICVQKYINIFILHSFSRLITSTINVVIPDCSHQNSCWTQSTKISEHLHFASGGLNARALRVMQWRWRTCATKAWLTPIRHCATSRAATRLSSSTQFC